MILKKTFDPARVWTYIRLPMLFVIGWSASVWFCFHFAAMKSLAINFTPVGVLGSALAIFVAFRNNSAYGRWWEARTLWGGIINNSRILFRQLIAHADNALFTGKSSPEKIASFKRETILRQAAFAHALRLQLRQQENWEELKHLLPETEFRSLLQAANKPNMLLLNQGLQIKAAIREEILGPFDNMSLEPTLAGLNQFQGGCERIKNTPLPRQYDFFTRLFVFAFSFLLPFGLLGLFSTVQNHSWLVMPLSIIVAGVFIIMERTGAANEDPFENRITDVPLNSICNTIERDAFEMLGIHPLPEKMLPANGYLM